MTLPGIIRLFSVKLARALLNKQDDNEIGAKDAIFSASASMRSLQKCETALDNTVNEVPELFTEIVELLGTLKEIKEGIKNEFPDVIM